MKQKHSPYRYYILGSQIAIIISVAVFVGYRLDEYLKTEKYYVTILLAVLAIIYTLTNLVRQIKK
tara:strand:- start:1177 stop:1371 length:195 start_codon:yes stop_codon:yes gene_type:complete